MTRARRGVQAGRGLRVIAGTAGGLRLVAPKGGEARPTTDRVKESLFAALGPDRLDGVTVLDLYAGSGALAIEALSRGAASALLVDRETAAATAIRRNLATTGLVRRARVQRSTVSAFLGGRDPAEAPFHLVFVDPPYGTPGSEVARVLGRLDDTGWLADAATVVVERGSGSGPITLPPSWGVAWERSYGDTLMTVVTTANT